MARREDIVAAARGWVGTPYRHQAALKGVGCDCLGLLRGVFREVAGGEVGGVPPYTPDWAEALGRETFAEGARRTMREISPDAALGGDVVLFRWRKHLPAKHAAILTGEGTMIHAQQYAAVTEAPLSDWWRRRIAYAFAFPGIAGDTASDPHPLADASRPLPSRERSRSLHATLLHGEEGTA